jgi:two-component system chemotaxis sensor kinase CheA
VSEARDHLAAARERAAGLARQPTDRDGLGELFRHAHTLKGMAATMGLEPIARLAHRLESLLNECRGGRRRVDPPLVDLVLDSLASIARMVDAAERGESIEGTSGQVPSRRIAALVVDPEALS